ncbi:MAG: hypothetical protein ACFFEY_11750 [Candidatus Thorarchaeota archaeon]
MKSIIYKVVFNAYEQFENKNLTLSFRNLNFITPLAIPSKNINKLKNISEKSKKFISFQNIEEVFIIGNPTSNYSYNNFLVVLYTLKNNGLKGGFLIGNVKTLGDLIIGIWPFNIKVKELALKKVLDDFNNLIENPDKYSNICLISQ